ncbi:MAG: radical SAM protein [Chitinivibrionales bacterium]|nr:radical SAM protein [Chitinivibrionales bacterium]
MTKRTRHKRPSETALPYLVVGDGCGNVFEVPELRMAGMTGTQVVAPRPKELIDLPHGSELFELPGHVPVGYDPQRGRFVELPSYDGSPVVAVAAFMAPAHVQFLRAAWRKSADAPRLPFYSYTAVGWRGGRFMVPAVRVDPDNRQDPITVDCAAVERRAQRMLARHEGNRLIEHLVNNCVRRYGCPAARNFMMGRWEAPLPTSPSCNADCVGCISRQSPASTVTAPQDRIAFVPSVDELLAVAVPHLERAPRAVVSFGQGCEGEPIMQAQLLEESIRAIRRRTARGIINLNTNGCNPEAVERLCRAGLDSIRVSMSSAQPSLYKRYYRPRGYTFDDAVESLKVIRRHNRWSSINYFVFAGLTDTEQEMTALSTVVVSTQINMIQARNLNIDPDWYLTEMGLGAAQSRGVVGVPRWLQWLSAEFPWVKVGYFNPPRSVMLRKHFAW